MSSRVRFSRAAEEELTQLYDFLAARDPRAAERALEAPRKAAGLLEDFPFSCRKAAGTDDPRYRELVVTFGGAGYVLLFEITDERTVSVLAVRHQREDDYYY